MSEVGVINEVDIDDGTQNMEVLAPLEEQQKQELAEDRNRVGSNIPYYLF